MAKSSRKQQKKELGRLIIAILGIFFYLGFILINSGNQGYTAGLVFIALLGMSFLILVNWDKIPKKRPERKLFALDDNSFVDLAIGVIAGLGIYFLIKLIPGLSLAVPEIPQSTTFSAFPQTLATVGQYLTVVGGASLVEEIAFRTTLLAVFWVVLGWSFFWSTFHTSWIFAIYHINAYAGEIAFDPILAVSGAFISAFLISFLFVYLNKLRGSVATSIGSHGAINAGILSQKLSIFAVG